MKKKKKTQIKELKLNGVTWYDYTTGCEVHSITSPACQLGEAEFEDICDAIETIKCRSTVKSIKAL